MNPEIKKKWIAALKSGEYKQGRNHLRKDGKYCCLGVLCELHAKETGGKWEKKHISSGELRNFYLTECNYLPDVVIDWAGLFEKNPYINGRGPLTALNDNGTPFNEIANLIEENL